MIQSILVILWQANNLPTLNVATSAVTRYKPSHKSLTHWKVELTYSVINLNSHTVKNNLSWTTLTYIDFS